MLKQSSIGRVFSAEIILAACFFVINIVLKLIYLTSRDIAWDEPFSIWYAQKDISSIFGMLKTENNPALHFLLLHFWIKLFGISPFSVRFLSALFSAITAVVVLQTGRRFFSRTTGIIAALIFTLSVMHMQFAHEARVYPLFVLLTALSLHSFLGISCNRSSKVNFVLLFVWNIMLIYAHYFGLIVVFTEVLCFFIIPGMRKHWKKSLFLIIALLLAYLPNILIFYKLMSSAVSQGTWVKPPAWTELYGNINRFVNTRWASLLLVAEMMITFFILLLYKSLWQKVKTFFTLKSNQIILIWFLVPYLLMFSVSFIAPMFLDRYILFTSVILYLIIAQTITHFIHRRTWIVGVAGLFLAGMLATFDLDPDNHRRVKEAVSVTNQERGQKGVLIISPEYADLEFTYHYNLEYFKDYTNTRTLLHSDLIFPTRDISSIPEIVLDTACTIVLLDCATEFAFGENPALKELVIKFGQPKVKSVYQIYKIYTFANFARNLH